MRFQIHMGENLNRKIFGVIGWLFEKKKKRKKRKKGKEEKGKKEREGREEKKSKEEYK